MKMKEKQESILPVPKGIKWEDITVTLSSHKHIKVLYHDKEERFHFGELGFLDKRKGDQPTKLWVYLKEIIKHKGELTWKNISEHKEERRWYEWKNISEPNDQLVKDASRLNTHLKKQFGIKDNIYTGHFRKKNEDGMTGYQLRFTTVNNLEYSKDKKEIEILKILEDKKNKNRQRKLQANTFVDALMRLSQCQIFARTKCSNPWMDEEMRELQRELCGSVNNKNTSIKIGNELEEIMTCVNSLRNSFPL